MQPIDYLDVELQVIRYDRARLLCPNRQEYVDTIHLDDGLRDRLLELEHTKDYQGYGRALFNAAFPAGTSLHRGIYSALDSSRKEGRRIRLRLNIDSAIPEGVHNFHWELISDGDDFEPARSPETLFSRYVSQPFAIGPAPSKPRLLCVIAAPIDAHRYQMAPIDYDLTSRHLRACFSQLEGHLEVDFLERPTTPERLREVLQNNKYELLHIHGHGTIARGGESALVLEDAQHKAHFTTETALRSILLGLSELKLVTLIACHGGAPSAKEDQLSGLAGSLVRRSVPAVIAMRRAISMSVGLRFTTYLYQQLAKSPCIDAAVNEARHRLFIDNLQGIDWSSPVLYMRLQDGLLWVPPILVPILPEPILIEKHDRGRVALLVQIALVILAFSFPNKYYDWIDGKVGVELYRGATNSIIRRPPPPGPSPPKPVAKKVPISPIAAGTIGIGAIDRESLVWRSDIARILTRKIQEKRPDLKPMVIPEEFRKRLGSMLNGDLSSLPGGGKAPYGFEHIFFAAETHGENPAKIVNFPTVNVSCEMTLIATHGPEVRSSQSFDHTGQASTEAGALEQAFGRCFDSALGSFP